MDIHQFDPDLRRAARFTGWLTPGTRTGFQRLVRVSTSIGRVVPRRSGTPTLKTRVKGDIEISGRWATRRDGSPLRLVVVRPVVPREGSTGVLWIHGGGYAFGSPDISVPTARRLVAATDCVVVLPDYRLSTQEPYPAALHDCYDALLWLRDHAAELGVATDQLVVGGESAGGGLTAAVTLQARDRGEVAVAFQVPLYPMIDERPTRSSTNNTAPVWNSATNDAAWDLYLGDLRDREVPAYAAPARADDLTGLPPTLTFFGELEPFRDEIAHYVERLEAAGVPVRSREFAGAFHAFDLMAPNAPVSRRARAFLLDGFRHFSATYRAEQPRG